MNVSNKVLGLQVEIGSLIGKDSTRSELID